MVMQQLHTQLSDTKERVDQLESQLMKLQEDNKTLETQWQNVQVDYELQAHIINF